MAGIFFKLLRVVPWFQNALYKKIVKANNGFVKVMITLLHFVLLALYLPIYVIAFIGACICGKIKGEEIEYNEDYIKWNNEVENLKEMLED